MIDLSKHYVSVDPAILIRNWGRYRDAYRSVEEQLPRFVEVPSSFVFKTHPLGGFLIKRETASAVKDLLEDDRRKFLLVHAGRKYSRGLAYYPGLLKDLHDMEKISFILSTLDSLLRAFIADKENGAVKLSVYKAAGHEYIRNYLLILLHAFHLITYRQNLIIREKDALDQLNNQLKSVLVNVEVALFRYITSNTGEVTLPLGELLVTVEKMRHFFDGNATIIEQEFQGKKLIREVREMDSLPHIFMFAKRLADMHFHQDTLLVGLEYGGIELPFAVNAVRIMQQKQKVPEVTLQISRYSNRLFVPNAIQDLVSFKTESRLIKKATCVWILDDSTTTGLSIERAARLFAGEAKRRIHTGIVAFKVSNRYHHLIMEDHGGFNPVVARNSVILCQANYTSTYRRNSYLNRSGIFDINKYNLYKMLGKEIL